MENIMSSKPAYEKIIFDRKDLTVRGYTFEKESDKAYVEHYVYKESEDGKTAYDMFLYKNPGLKKYLRFKLHGWGVQTMESIIKKEADFAARLREQKEKLLEAKDKMKEKINETKEKIEERKEKTKEKLIETKEKIEEIVKEKMIETKEKLEEKLQEPMEKTKEKILETKDKMKGKLNEKKDKLREEIK